MSKEQDKEKLIEFYKTIQEIAGELYEMDKRYPATRKFHETMKRQVIELDKIAHEFFEEIKEIENE